MPKRAFLLRAAVCLLSVLPALDLWRALRRMNPEWIAAYDYGVFSLAIANTGTWAFIFLFLTLACSPVQGITRMRWPGELRRTLGLFAFGYTLLHFLVYMVVGQKLRFDYAWQDAFLTKSRLPGWGALLLLLPLAVTSTDAMVRWLGGKFWKRLHLLVFPATALAIWHLQWTEADHASSDFENTRRALWIFGTLILLRLALKARKLVARSRSRSRSRS